MIIELQGATAQNVAAARRTLEEMARSWGQEITEAPAEATRTAGTTDSDHDKAIDPVSL
jgi:hypothetical protein